MVAIVVYPAKRPLSGSVPIPADLAMVERWALLASVAQGRSRITWSGDESPIGETLGALGIETAVGVTEEAESKKKQRHLEIQGRGLWGLVGASEPLNAELASEPQALLGMLAAQRFSSRLSLPASDAHALTQLAELLNGRGARIEAAAFQPGESLRIAIQSLNPDQRLDGLERAMLLRPAGLKSGLFFSGLFARSPTTLHETWVSADHCERLFDAVGLPLAAVGPTVSLHPPASADAIRPFSGAAPGDASLATAICVAAQMVPGSQVTVRNVNLNRTRLGLLDFLRQLGARIGDEVRGEVLGESHGQITIFSEMLRAGSLDLEFAARIGSEMPLVCAALSRANGCSSVVGFSKICPRAQEVVELLRAFGIIAEMPHDTLEIEGGQTARTEPIRIHSLGDPWRAITATLLGLASGGETVIDDAECVARRFPRFVGTLRSLGASIEVRA